MFNYGIFIVRERAGRFVGEVGLAHFARGFGEQFDPFPEASWVLASHGHGHGYATEAAFAVHDWMAQTHHPSRTVCIIRPDNLMSVRIAVKLGYTKFGKTEYRGGTPTMFERRYDISEDAVSS